MAIKHHAAHRDIRRPGLFWSRLHFLVRFLGLTGAVCALVGLVLLEPASWQAIEDVVVNTVTGTVVPQVDAKGIGAYLLTGGAAAVALALLVEALVILFGVAGRRSAFGFNAVLQAAMAAALLVGINYWSFGHSLRFDCTREKLFTLPTDLRERLRELDAKGKTTVVVYQRHKTFGALTDKPDRFDYAAEKKVVDKLKDVVALLREVGPQLSVEELDVEQEGFDDKLAKLTEHAPELRKAIEAAPENSIFISNRAGLDKKPETPEYVQQMSFNELYQLDKVKSREDNHDRGNLVLLGQGDDGRGIRPFVRKVLNLEQRRPRVGVLTIHQVLTTEGPEASLTLSGLRKALASHGFEVKDVVLKKGWGRGFPEAAADTFDESKLEELESDLEDVEGDVKGLADEVKVLKDQVKDMTPKPGEDVAKRLAELSEKYREQLRGGKLTVEARTAVLSLLNRQLSATEEELGTRTKERDRLRGERDKLDVDRITEARRLTDVKAKLAYALADCDVLFIPRLTRMTASGELIEPRLYSLDPGQVSAIKDFLKSGKPIFACLGPINERSMSRMPPGAPPGGPDGLENLLGDLGVKLGRQTILYPSDGKALAERRVNLLRPPTAVDVPAVDFDSKTDAIATPWLVKKEELPPNLLHEGLRVTANSVGTAFNLRVRFPRPIYYEPPKGKEPDHEPTFLISPVGWNEDQPFATASSRPRFAPPSPTDPNNGSFDAKRRGQFPIGVAVEAAMPEEWGKEVKDKKVRLAVIGQGEVLVGPELRPPQERVLLQTVNWLLGRDDYLPTDEHPWSYPRLPLTPEDSKHKLWWWGTTVGLPVLFAYLGFVVLLFRRLR
jgi:hypothetical protein